MIIEVPQNWKEFTSRMMTTAVVGLLNQTTFCNPNAERIVFSAPCWYWKIR